MYLGYNTNGLAHHRLEDAIRLLAELGYRGVAITIDHGALAPGSPTLAADLEQVRSLLAEHQMRCVIETGARYLLDYRRKHHPTLVSASAEDRQQRVAFIEHAIDVAKALSADCVSLWSGIPDDAASPLEYMQRLVDGLNAVAATAQSKEVILAFEPEPGMYIDTMAKFDELMQFIPSPNVALTIDLGHLHCLGETPIENYVVRYSHLIKNIHLEDMRRGVHEHLMFGEGEMDIPAIVDALANAGYQGGVFVELSRHSHAGPEIARRAFEYLQPLADWKV